MHDIVNELTTSMGQKVLRQLSKKIKSCNPSCYAIIADEATDVIAKEQFNPSIRYVSDEYDINEDSIVLFCLPNSTSDTLYTVVKDILTHCALPLSLYRGKAYDGVAAMQGRRKGLSTHIRSDVPAAVPVHCLVYSLNLCLQDVGK